MLNIRVSFKEIIISASGNPGLPYFGHQNDFKLLSYESTELAVHEWQSSREYVRRKFTALSKRQALINLQ